MEPSCSDLPAFGSVVMSITAYSDMWGEYTDQLTCQVSRCNKVFKSSLLGIFPSELVDFTVTSTIGPCMDYEN